MRYVHKSSTVIMWKRVVTYLITFITVKKQRHLPLVKHRLKSSNIPCWLFSAIVIDWIGIYLSTNNNAFNSSILLCSRSALLDNRLIN